MFLSVARYGENGTTGNETRTEAVPAVESTAAGTAAGTAVESAEGEAEAPTGTGTGTAACTDADADAEAEADADADGAGRPGRRPAVLRVAGFGLAAALVLVGATAAWAYWRLDGNITGVDIDRALGDDRPQQPLTTPSASPAGPPVPSGALNILVLGSDTRSGAENRRLGGGDGDGDGGRSDTAMIVHLDPGRTSATVVSIPRDTLVSRPSCPLPSGGETAPRDAVMFNSAYAVGGPVCAVKTVERLTGVRMDHYAELDFAGFARLVDAVGGVVVTTDEDIDDEDSHLSLESGTHLLDGEQALALARTRHGIGDGSDLGRIGLQQRLVTALLERISGRGLFTDPARLYRVADAVTGGLTTDTGLDSLTELVGLGRSLSGLSADRVRTVMMPVVPALSDPNRVVADEEAAAGLWESLR